MSGGELNRRLYSLRYWQHVRYSLFSYNSLQHSATKDIATTGSKLNMHTTHTTVEPLLKDAPEIRTPLIKDNLLSPKYAVLVYIYP